MEKANYIINHNKKIDIELIDNKNDLYIFNKKYIISESSSEITDLDEELEEQINYPKNHGKIWNNEDKKIIIKILKKNNTKINNIFNSNILNKIANKLERSTCSVLSEIKKIIFNKYIDDCLKIEEIANELNICDSHIKIIISMYLDKNVNKSIELLDKENRILKLKIENLKLKKELKELKEF